MTSNVKISLKLLWNHVLCCILTLVFLPIFGWLIKKDNGILIFSCILSFFYFTMIYSDMWEVAYKDNKSYSKTKPYLLKGLLLGSFASIISIVMAIVFYVAKAGVLNFDIVNFIYRMWMPMFIGFFETYQETFPAIFGLVVLVLPAASFLGYWAGMHKFSLQDRIIRLLNRNAQRNSK